MRPKAVARLATAVLVAAPAFAEHRHGDGRERPIRTCADVRMQFDGRPTARDEQQLSVPASEANPLRLRPDVNGGVVVWGGTGSDYAVTVCRVAAGDSRAEAEAALRGIAASAAGGQVTVSGPRGGRWAAFLLVSAPRGAHLDVDVQNGPVSFDGVDGTVLARTLNGPISLAGVSGTVEASAQNGPISVEQGSGDYTLRADNGPLSLELLGDHWDGHFEGRSENGPISIELPRSFASSLRIESSPWAPASCRAAVCEGARWQKTGRSHVLEVGSGSPSLSLKTVNGPLSVSNSGS